jgi:hypothetical protein
MKPAATRPAGSPYAQPAASSAYAQHCGREQAAVARELRWCPADEHVHVLEVIVKFATATHFGADLVAWRSGFSGGGTS